MLRVLSTKILDEKLIAIARDMRMSLECVEMIGARVLDFDRSLFSLDIYDAIVFTSSNAVKAFTPPLQRGSGGFDYGRTRVYSLSGKTKDELEKNSITPVAVADSASQLADKIMVDKSIKSVLHICGNLKLDTLGDKLTASGISYKPLIVYETIPVSNEISEAYDAVMFYSPSGIDSFLMKNKLALDTLYCCIGEATADRLRSIDNSVNIVVAKQPTPEEMLKAIIENKSK